MITTISYFVYLNPDTNFEIFDDDTLPFHLINQTDIFYLDTHVEHVDGIHYATINQTKIIDENTIKIKFTDNAGYVGGNGNIIYRIPQFEFTAKVDVGDKFISRCVERE